MRSNSPPLARAPAVRPAVLVAGPGRNAERRRRGATLLAVVLPGAVTLAVMLWRIQGPSFWRDEAATIAAIERPFPALIRTLGNVDAVHGAYYLLMWVVTRAAGHGELALRMPSAIAMAAAAVGIAALGRRLCSPAAGLAGGLLFAFLPAVSWFGQDARPFAVEAALATGATYLLVRAANAPAGARGWLWAYGAALTALGLSDIIGLLIIGAHALTVWRGRRGGGALVRGWLIATGVACLMLTPLMALEWSQRHQVGWLGAPGMAGLESLRRLVGPLWLCAAAGVIITSAVALSALPGLARLRADWPPALLAVCVPWLCLPPAVLFAVSLAQPIYTFRYVVFCLPASALLLGTALAALGRAVGDAAAGALRHLHLPGRPRRPRGRLAGLAAPLAGGTAGALVLVLIVLLGLTAETGERGPVGHGDNIRGVDLIIAAHEHRGDAVLYPGGIGMASFAVAYPYGLATLHDVEIKQSAARSATISGTAVDGPVVRRRLAAYSRVWELQANRFRPDPLLRGLRFRLEGHWHVSDIWLRLYVRAASVTVTSR